MTQTKLAPSPAEGHGLTDRVTDAHYTAYSKGEPIEVVPALVLLKVCGNGGHDTANGRVNTVRYEITRLEPFANEDRTDALWQIQAMYEARTSTGSQRPLPLGLPNEERRQFLMERIEDWAKDNDVNGSDLEAMWRAEFGIGDVDGADYGTPADYRHASVQKLLQFALECGAEKEKGDDNPPAVMSADGDSDALAEPDDDPLTGDADPQPDSVPDDELDNDGETTPTVPPVGFSDKKPRGRRGGIAAVPDGGK